LGRLFHCLRHESSSNFSSGQDLAPPQRSTACTVFNVREKRHRS
jgi:hypothetical protein